eukprot:TRINITY_DN20803_c0_g1_i1.p1 TRINITY_DN20803_c0_g1~~TRINITY_DN20803_c0_g1_i1.p1  ORF type:complete len:497 (+),score=84.53 TRINITY_DN20803_c0_g1_i1:29-1519(+)
MDCYYGQPQPLRFVPNPCIPSSSSSSNNPIYPFTTGGEAGGRTRPGLYLMTGGNEPAFPVPGWAAANPPTKKTLARSSPPAARPTPPTKKTLARSSPPAAAPAVQRPPTLAPTSLPFLGQQSLDSMAHAAAVCYHSAVAPHQHQVACEPHVEQPVEAQCTQQLPEIIPDNATILQEDCAAQQPMAARNRHQIRRRNQYWPPRVIPYNATILNAGLKRLRQLVAQYPRPAAALPGASVLQFKWLQGDTNGSEIQTHIVPLEALLNLLELDQGNRMPEIAKSGKAPHRKFRVWNTHTGQELNPKPFAWVTPSAEVEPWTLIGGWQSTTVFLGHGTTTIMLQYIGGDVKLANSPDGSFTSVRLFVHMRFGRVIEEMARMPSLLLFTKAKPEEPEPKTKERGRADERKGQTKDYLVMDLEPVVRNFTELTTVLGGSGERDLPLLLWGLEKPLREFLQRDRVPGHVTQQLERKLRALLLLGQGIMGMHQAWSDMAGGEQQD